jgi:hypothetical protein
MDANDTDIPVASPSSTWRRHLRRLIDDERGVALTEFVVTLPIFIMLFAAVVWMGQAYQRMVESDVRATFDMWDSATNVQHHRVPSRLAVLHPTTSAVTLRQRYVDEGLSLDASDAMYGAATLARAAKGTHGESSVYMVPVAGAVPGMSRSDIYEDAHEHIQSGKHGEFANSVMNDGPGSSGSPPDVSSSTGSGPLSRFSGSFPTDFDQGKHGFVQSLGANIRWGDAYGRNVENNVELGNWSVANVESGFDVMVAPYAPDAKGGGFADTPVAQELLSTTVLRGLSLVKNQHCYPAMLPGIQSSSDYQGCNN